MVGLILHTSCACCHSHCELLCVNFLLCTENTASLHLSTVSGSWNLSEPSSAMILSPGREMWYKCPIEGRLLYRLLFLAHWPVVGLVFTAIIYKNKLLWWGLRDVFIYGYKDNNVERSLLLYPFTRKIVVGSHSGPIPTQPEFVVLSMVPGMSSWEEALIPIYNIRVSTAPMARSSQGSHLDMIITFLLC